MQNILPPSTSRKDSNSPTLETNVSSKNTPSLIHANTYPSLQDTDTVVSSHTAMETRDIRDRMTVDMNDATASSATLAASVPTLGPNFRFYQPSMSCFFTIGYLEHNVKKAMQEAQDKIPHITRDYCGDIYQNKIAPFRLQITSLLNRLLDNSDLKTKLNSVTLNYVKNILVKKLVSLLGNEWGVCGEATSPAFISLAQTPIKTELFVVSQENVAHELVVYNRKFNSDCKDPRTWGDDCYICDPFNHTYYRANSIPDNDLLTLNMKNPKKFSVLIPLDSSIGAQIKDPKSKAKHIFYEIDKIIAAKNMHDLEVVMRNFISNITADNQSGAQATLR